MKVKSILVSLALLSSISADANILPEWHGFWQGQCLYDDPNGTPTETIPFTLDIQPVSATEVTWNMHYYRISGDIVKNYTLRVVDEASGHYEIDEHNGIIIDEYLRQNQLMSNFEVNKRNIITASKLDGNQLTYTAYSFGTAPERRFRKEGVTVFSEPALEACSLTR
ncbi:MAG: hypothetical protein HWD86_03495 [Kangiellaceae bacterium]|nr:hypothetical protein [Kangiellaceae bacterium]